MKTEDGRVVVRIDPDISEDILIAMVYHELLTEGMDNMAYEFHALASKASRTPTPVLDENNEPVMKDGKPVYTTELAEVIKLYAVVLVNANS